MLVCIDRFSSLLGIVIVEGWSDAYQPGAKLVIVQNGQPLETVTVPVDRPDVAAHHGPEAATWAFRSYGVLAGRPFCAQEFGLRFPSGESLDCLPNHRPRDDSHSLFETFVEEVNATGGTVLEIGARRAPNGTVRRGRFTSNVKYIGVDLKLGENVDIAVDAHHLSDAIKEPVDFVFSHSTFEHFLMPWKVVLEINKVLRVGGKVFSHSHQTWPGHDEPWDYFRFSRESWAGLYNKHTGFRVCDARRGEKVAVINFYNPGAPFDEMEHSPGWGMSVCVAEKVSNPIVRWDAPVADIQAIEYDH
jgi:hypothetical protein